MNTLRAFVTFLDDIKEVLTDCGWKDGDAADGFTDGYNSEDKYFFLDLIKNAYLENYAGIRQLYAVYSVGSAVPENKAEGDTASATVSGFLYIYLPDPLTKEKLLDFEDIENGMKEKGWELSVNGSSAYDTVMDLRQLQFSFTKSVWYYETDTDN